MNIAENSKEKSKRENEIEGARSVSFSSGVEFGVNWQSTKDMCKIRVLYMLQIPA